MSIDNNLPLNVSLNVPLSVPLSESERAQISDLADGRLRGDAFADAMAFLDANSQAGAYWHGLHTIGDSLRGDATADAANITKDLAFLDGFRANLAKELRLTPVTAPANAPNSHTITSTTSMPTANDSFFNWKWMGGLSAAAAVMAFSWNLVSTTATSPNGAGSQLAQSAVQTAPVALQTAAGVMLRNPQLDALIAAHNQAGGSSALQMPSGFLRSATFNAAMPATVVSDK